jgi:4'-phosphopantetheinyl transferase EntD
MRREFESRWGRQSTSQLAPGKRNAASGRKSPWHTYGLSRQINANVSSHTSSGKQADGSFPNPAVASPAIEALFPPGVVAADLREPGDPALLDPAEARAVARSVPKRVREFTAGRLCARRALARLAIEHFPVRAAEDRQPLWPPGLVGSITHTAGFCAAAVAERPRFTALGIDTEVADAVNPALWPRTCLPAELDWIFSLPYAERARAATLVFCAKEAFYKCQYPSTGEWLDFSDVRVTPLDWGASLGCLAVTAQRPLRIFEAREEREPVLHAAYRFHEGFVSAGVALLR